MMCLEDAGQVTHPNHTAKQVAGLRIFSTPCHLHLHLAFICHSPGIYRLFPVPTNLLDRGKLEVLVRLPLGR